MNETKNDWKPLFLCAAAVLVTIFAVAGGENLWGYLGVYPMRPHFADLAAVFAAGEARQAGLDVYSANPYDPFGRPHVYGPWWLATGNMGLTTADTWWAGLLLNAGFLATALAMLRPRTAGQACMTFLLLVSPPVLLGVERANNDLIIFLLLAAAGAILARPWRWAAAGAGGVLLFAAALKFYPLAAVPAIGVRIKGRGRLIAAGAVCLALFGVLWWLQRAEFSRALAIAPRPETVFAYGLRLFDLSWTAMWVWRPWLILGYAVGAALVLVPLWPARARLAGALPLTGREGALAIMGAGCWLFCYALNSNFAYRAVLLLPIVPWLFQLAGATDLVSRIIGRRLGMALVGALWLAAPKYWWIQIILLGDEASTSVASRWIVFILGAEQTMLLALSLVLAVCLGGWAWRRLRGATD